VLNVTQLKVTTADEMSVAQLAKQPAKHKSGPLFSSCRLKFASQRELTMVEGGLPMIHPLRYLSCISVHKHKAPCRPFPVTITETLHSGVKKLKIYLSFN